MNHFKTNVAHSNNKTLFVLDACSFTIADPVLNVQVCDATGDYSITKAGNI